MNKLTPQQRLRLLSEYKAGKTSGILARRYGVTANYVHVLASRNGYRRDYSWHEEARRAVQSGARPTDLAAKYNVTPQHISMLASRA